MKLWYKTVLNGEVTGMFDKPDGIYDYVLLEKGEPCCSEMKEALDDEAIGFGRFIDRPLNDDNSLTFASCHPFAEGAVWDFYTIKFCPFCGTKVETIERERVKLKLVKKKQPAYYTDTVEVPVKQNE